MVARGRDGTLRSYPVVETAHKDNICHTVEAPAAIPGATARAALKVAEKAVGCLYGAGVFGVELFLLPDGQVRLEGVRNGSELVIQLVFQEGATEASPGKTF